MHTKMEDACSAENLFNAKREENITCDVE